MCIDFGRAGIGVPKPAGDIPQLDALLSQPGATGMPQRMRRYVIQTSAATRVGERMFDLENTLAMIAEHIWRGAPRSRFLKKPAQPPRDRHDGATFVGALSVRRIEIDHTAIEVDLWKLRLRIASLRAPV